MKITTGSDKEINFKDIKAVYYAGIVRSQEETSTVAVSIFENEFVGMISIAGVGNLVIGKIKDSTHHVVYNEKLDNSTFDFVCEAGNLSASNSAINSFSNTSNENISIRNKCLKIYYETAFSVFQAQNSIVNVVSYVTSLHNFVAVLYLNEGIKTPLSEIKVWDTLETFGNSFLSYITFRTSYNGDIGQLLRLNTSAGGAPIYPNSDLCTRLPNQKLSYAGLSGALSNWPIYSRPVYVMTHEFGHTLGSNHTSDCVWNDNNTQIDGCNNIFANCQSTIIPPVNVGGTIMSYCTAFNGINFNNGFGPQPGDLIRNSIGLSTCLETCNSCVIDKIINTVTTTSKYEQVSNNISNMSIINDNLNINYNAIDILFLPGFAVKSNFFSSFIAKVNPCADNLGFKPNKSIFMNIKKNTSLKNLEFEISGLEIYPNPIKNSKMLFIKSEQNLKKQILIFDFLGKEVLNIITSQNVIDVENLGSGVYIVKVNEEGKTATRKLVIQ